MDDCISYHRAIRWKLYTKHLNSGRKRMTKKSTKKGFLIAYLFIAILLITITYYVSVHGLNEITQKGTEKEYVHNVTMNIITPTWSVNYSSMNTSNVTVADFLFECCERLNMTVDKDYWPGYDSFFITRIDSYSNGDDERYWQYYVNGLYADTGCSLYILNNNDMIEWRFETSSWGK